MPKRRRSSDSSRRNFLKAAGFVGAAAATVRPATAGAIPAPSQQRLKAAIPGPRQTAAENMPPTREPVNQTSSGGDFMSMYSTRLASNIWQSIARRATAACTRLSSSTAITSRKSSPVCTRRSLCRCRPKLQRRFARRGPAISSVSSRSVSNALSGCWFSRCDGPANRCSNYL